MPQDNERIGDMSNAERQRIDRLLSQIGGANVNWGAANVLDVWITEHRMRSEANASARLTRATWVLVLATAVLAFATIALVIATVAHGG